jgi:hypothetical protein
VYASVFVAELREDIRITIPAILECLKHGNPAIPEVAIKLLSRLAVQGMRKHHFSWVRSTKFVDEFREDVRITIPAIGEHLKDSHSYVIKAAIELLSRLAAQGMPKHHFLAGVLKHDCS